MKELKLKKLVLSNFKGQNSTFIPCGNFTYVKGANGVGKTSIYKAFCWLLSGYTDSINGKNHELYDNRCEINKDTPSAIVSADLVIDGCEFKIERRAKAKFSRKRGSNEYVKDSSDSYTLLIDDIETNVGDFNSFIDKMFGSSDMINYMLLGERFANLTIEDRNKARKILENITGNVSIDEMEGDYSEISKELNVYSVEQIKDRFKNQLKPLKQRIIEIDALIERKESDYKSYDEGKFTELDTRISEFSDEIKQIDELVIGKSKSLEPLIRERNSIIEEIESIRWKIVEQKAAYRSSMQDKENEILKEINSIKAENAEIERRNAMALRQAEYARIEYDKANSQLNSLELERERLIKKRDEIKERVFTEDKCAYCGQELPFGELEAAKKRFNEEKISELESVVRQGKAVKERIVHQKEVLLEIKSKMEFKTNIEQLKDSTELDKKLEDFKKTIIPFEDTISYKKAISEISELEKRIPKINEDNTELIERKEFLMKELKGLNREYGMKTYYETISNDIKDLCSEKREVGCRIAELEGLIDKVREYEEEKANIVSDKINKRLSDCKIVMYSRQKDGELKPDCVIVDSNGVKYATLNNSARIKICLNLQRLFCEHFDTNMPMFVDESSVFDSYNLPRFKTQMVYLLASDDKTLKIE